MVGSEKKSKRSSEQESEGAKWADWVKNAVSSGLGSVGDIKAPAEVFLKALAQADKTKSEAIGAIAREFRGFLASFEMQELIVKLLHGATFEINATVKINAPEKNKIEVKDVKVTKKSTAAPQRKKTTVKKNVSKSR